MTIEIGICGCGYCLVCYICIMCYITFDCTVLLLNMEHTQMLKHGAILRLSFRHQMTNNVMERHNRDINNLFDLPNPGLAVFCERVREEAVHWEKRHKEALKGHFTNRQESKEVPWPDILAEFRS